MGVAPTGSLEGAGDKYGTLLESPGGRERIISCQVPVPEVCFMDFSLERLEHIFRALSESIVGSVLAGSPLEVKVNSQDPSGFTAGNKVCVLIISGSHRWVLLLLRSLAYGAGNRTKNICSLVFRGKELLPSQ